MKGVRLFVPTERIRRRGLVKQFKTAPRFRERVGVRKKLLSLVPRGTAGEAIGPVLQGEEGCDGQEESYRDFYGG